MPKGSKAEKAERALRAEGLKRGYSGDRLDRYVYGGLNAAGLMKGSKTTARGKQKASKKK